MSLATKYRPTKFSDVVEQNITTTILQKQIENKTFKNAYLFAGTTGCGKTTAARIFANMINNGLGNPIELDSSMLTLDDVRVLGEEAKVRAISGEYKVFILDECHRLSGDKKDSYNTLLKIIEDCPKYTIFIFCTTEPQKLIPTFVNRLQRFNFAPISSGGIKTRLEYICQQEGFTNYQDSCEFISKVSNNSMREAITNLEQVADLSKDLNLDITKKVLGGLSYETMFKLTWALQNKQEKELFTIIDDLYTGGQDLKHFIDIYIGFILDLSKYIIFKDINITSIPAYLAATDNAVVQFTVEKDNSLDYFNCLADELLKIKTAIKNDMNYKDTILVMLINLVR